MSVSPKTFDKRPTPVYATNYSDSAMKISQNSRKTATRKFTKDHGRQRSKFEEVTESKTEDNKDETKETELQRTSSSFTTDDLDDIPKYKRGNRVLCRPSGDKDEKWKPGTIQEIMEIDNEYLSSMSAIDDNNKSYIPSFAQYYIPSSDKTRVRPLYHKEHKDKKCKDNNIDNSAREKII